MIRLLLPIMLFACHTLPGEGGPGTGEEEAVPVLRIVSPEAGDGVYGTEIVTTYEVENFTLDPTGEEGGERVGHVHAYLDGALVGEVTEESFTFTGVPSGDHVLDLRLADNDHDEHWGSNELDVPTRSPALSIATPVDGVELLGSSVPLTLTLSDYDVSPSAAFGDPAFGQGRYRVLVDDVDVDLGVDPLGIEVGQLPEGPHTVGVELVDADGLPLDPPVRDDVDLGVAPGSPYLAVDRTPYRSVLASATVPLAVTTLNAPVDYHVYLDGTFAGHATTDTTLRHVAPGYHDVELRLTHGGSELPVHDHVHLFVAPDRPDVTITSPGDQWGVASELDLTVGVENFTLDPDLGGAVLPGHGHWAVSVDGVEAAESATGAAHLSGLPTGDHVLRVELKENDRTPLDPPVYDEITVSVG